MQIKEVVAKNIKDSRGEDTVEISVNGSKASSPSGKSTGKHETPSYHKSIDWNINFFNKLKIKRINFEINSFDDLEKLESFIKKEAKLKNVKDFGANALYAFESAILKALAKSQKKQLWQIINEKAKKIPIPVGNVVGGGLHSHSENHPTFQEFLIIPKEKSTKANVEMMNEVYNEVGKMLFASKKNDEGAWETNLQGEEVLDVLYQFKDRVDLGVDVAASTFYEEGNYKHKKITLRKDHHILYINGLIEKYNLLYCEDPINEEDFIDFSKIKKKNLVVGDDLTATQIARLHKAIKNKSINAMIIKPNQNGSLIELKEIFSICRKNKIKTVISHRSGETMDSGLADYALGFSADYIKTGISTKWRECKLNRLIEIEKSIS